MQDSPWLLPAGIDEMLPEDARCLENLRRRLLDLYDSWGYELVIPPLIEFLESLLTGTGSDLDIQTFKLTDQISGRMMGIRADMTPQVARLDAHRLRRSTPTRLCYLGTVLHTLPDGFAGSRNPYQVGAELYGHAGPESDAEVLCLMLATLKATGVQDIYIDLGHVGIYRELARQADLDTVQEAQLFDLLQRKALPEMQAFLTELEVEQTAKDRLAALAKLNGNAEILIQAREMLQGAGDQVMAAIDYVEKVAELVNRRLPETLLHYDLAELRGYHYQTGVVFAAFVPGYGQEIARGGRYDDIGKVFGGPRPATGFSADLQSLIVLVNEKATPRTAIFAPAMSDPALIALVEELRSQGERVIVELPGQVSNPVEQGCDRILLQQDGKWTLAPVK
jgi:ATP phosphoribosyltransferase regulatory subunit